MCQEINISVNETNENINITSTEVVEVIDINVGETVEEVTLNITEEIIQVNINKITGGGGVISVNGETGIVVIDIPTNTSDLTNDSNFIVDADYTHTDNNFTDTLKTKLDAIQEGAEVNVNADWNATSGDAQILNKPSLTGFGDMFKSTYDTDNTGIVDNAEAIKIIGRNSTGSTLRKGTIIYISGSTGNRPNFVKAKADTEATSAGTFGVIADDIPNNTDGYALCLGYLDNLDTRSNATFPFTSDTLVDGDTIYLSPTTAGYITNVKPLAPNHLVYLGKVTRTSPTQGTIVYRIQNGYELEELHNVAISSVVDKQLLSYDSAAELWKNKSVTTADIADSTNKRYVTDAEKTVIGNTSGTNTGDNATNSQYSGLASSKEDTSNKQADLTASATKFPTVNAVNVGLATKQQDLFDFIDNGIIVYDDYISTSYVSGSTNWNQNSGSNSSGNSLSGAQGTQICTTGILTVGGGGTTLGDVNAGSFFIGNGAWSYKRRVYIPTLSNATDRYVIFDGLQAGSSFTNSPNMVGFIYDEGGTYATGVSAGSPNWKCFTVNGGVRTITTSSTAVASATWTKLRIEINAAGTSVGFYVDNVLVATHTTNIPASTTALHQGNFIVKSAGTTARTYVSDYISIKQILTTSR